MGMAAEAADDVADPVRPVEAAIREGAKVRRAGRQPRLDNRDHPVHPFEVVRPLGVNERHRKEGPLPEVGQGVVVAVPDPLLREPELPADRGRRPAACRARGRAGHCRRERGSATAARAVSRVASRRAPPDAAASTSGANAGRSALVPPPNQRATIAAVALGVDGRRASPGTRSRRPAASRRARPRPPSSAQAAHRRLPRRATLGRIRGSRATAGWTHARGRG